MDLTCFQCKKDWEVPQPQIIGAKLKFALGFKEHAFVCPNCHAKNEVTKQAFEDELEQPHHAAAAPAPAAPKPAPKPAGPAPKPAAGPTAPKPAAPPVKPPVPAPVAPRPVIMTNAPSSAIGAGPVIKERHGVVIVRSLRVRKDHSTSSETVAGLVRNEKVTILSTWTDGDDTWAQLGPDRWAAIIYNGEALIELTD